MAEERKRTERLMGERADRRRRDENNFDFNGSKNLLIPEEIEAQLKAEGWTPRWVHDEKGRIQRLTTKDDYEKVPGVEPVLVGADKEGKPILAHLLAKPAEFLKADQQKRDVRRREVEQAIVKGKVPAVAEGKVAETYGAEPAPIQGHLGAETYVPDGNEIGRENRVIE